MTPPCRRPAERRIAVVSRGLCTFTEKIAAIELAGYDAAIVVNREGFDGCGPFGMTVEGGIPAFSVERSVGFGLFDEGGYDNAACLAGTGELIPGRRRSAGGRHGHADVVLRRLGLRPPLPQQRRASCRSSTRSRFPRRWIPTTPRASATSRCTRRRCRRRSNNRIYFSYYSGGVRVLEIQDDELVEVGHFIDEGGNNFWGVQVFSQGGKEYFAASDMAYGLYIFEYTG